jgi:hypothetical protein
MIEYPRNAMRLGNAMSSLAAELLHLPDKPAGVAEEDFAYPLAAELLHLPDKPAGVANSGRGKKAARAIR